MRNISHILKTTPKVIGLRENFTAGGGHQRRGRGGAVLGAYIVVVINFAVNADTMLLSQEKFMAIISPIIVATIILITICYKKGESPRWQWGIKEEEK